MDDKKNIDLADLIRTLDMEQYLVSIPEDEKQSIISNIEVEVENYRITNYKRIVESQEEISSFVLTS